MPDNSEILVKVTVDPGSAEADTKRVIAALEGIGKAAVVSNEKIKASQEKAIRSTTAQTSSFASLQASMGSFDTAIESLTAHQATLEKGSTAYNRVGTQLQRTLLQQERAIVSTATSAANARKAVGDLAGAETILQGALGRVTEGTAQHNRLLTSLGATQQAITKGTTAQVSAYAALKVSGGDWDRAIQSLTTHQRTLQVGSEAHSKISTQLTEAYKGQSRALLQTALNTAAAQRATHDFEGSQATLKAALGDTRIGFEGQQRLITELGRQSDNTLNRIRQMSSHLTRIGLQLSVAISLPLEQLAQRSIQSFLVIDQFRRSLTAVGGNAAEAAEQLKRLQVIAVSPGLTFQSAVQGVVRLEAVGFKAKQAEEIVRELGNALALTGGTAEELVNINVQLTQMAGKGKVVAQDLRPILSAAPVIAQAVTKLFGTVDAERISAQLDAAGKSAKDFIQILTKGLEELPRVQPGAREAILRFTTALEISLAKIGEVLAQGLIPLLDAFSVIISSLADLFAGLPGPAQTFIVLLTGMIAILPVAILLLSQFLDTVVSLKLGMVALQEAVAAGKISGGLLAFLQGLPGILPVLIGLAATALAISAAVAIYNAVSTKAVEVTKQSLAEQIKLRDELQKSGKERLALVGQMIREANAASDLADQHKNEPALHAEITRAIEIRIAAAVKLEQEIQRVRDIQNAALQAQLDALASNIQQTLDQMAAAQASIEAIKKEGIPEVVSVSEFGAPLIVLEKDVNKANEAITKFEEILKTLSKTLIDQGSTLAGVRGALSKTVDVQVEYFRSLGVTGKELDAYRAALNAYAADLTKNIPAEEKTNTLLGQRKIILDDLSNALKAFDISKAQGDVRKTIENIALGAATPAEAVRKAREEMAKADGIFRRGVEETNRVTVNSAAIQAALITKLDQRSASTSRVTHVTNLALAILKEELRTLELLSAQRAKLAEEDPALDREERLKLQIALEEQLLKKRLEVFEKERAEVRGAKLPAQEKLEKIKKVDNDELAAKIESQNRIRELEKKNFDERGDELFTALHREEDIARGHAQTLIEIQEATRRRRVADAKRAADLGITDFVDAERESIVEERKILEARRGLAQETLASDLATVEQKEAAVDQIAKINAELVALEEGTFTRIEEARQKDLDRLRAYTNERIAISQKLVADIIAARAAEIKAELGSRDPARRRAAQLAQLQLDRDDADARLDEHLAQIEKDRQAQFDAALLAGHTIGEARVIAEITANARILAARRQHAAEMEQITQAQTDAGRGAIARGLQGAADVLQAQVGDLSDTIKESYLTAVSAANQATQQMLDTWIETGKTGPAVFKKLVHEILKELAHLWLAKGIAEMAEGFAALFLHPGKAAGHFISAGYYFTAAAVAGILARVTAPKEAGAAGRAATGTSGGTSEESQRVSFTRGLAAGLIGGFKEAIDPFLIQQRQLMDQFGAIADEQAKTQDALTSVTVPLAQLADTVTGMDPGDVVAVGADRNPRAFARGTARGISRDAWSWSDLGDNLGVTR